MNYSIHPKAESELIHAIEYYNQCRRGLGVEFLNAVESTINTILDLPFGWPNIHPKARRCLTKRFPFGVIYRVNSDTITILAIMHLHQKPNYWINRL